MLASLIPFFLVARVTIDDSAWKYGPEYVFDVEVNVTRNPANYDVYQMSNYTTMKLFCRPTGSQGLNCHLGQDIKQVVEITKGDRVDTLNVKGEQLNGFYTDEPFEIRFNEYGVDRLIVDNQIEVRHLNNIKLLAERFDIGADLNGMPDGTFDAVENSTCGTCNVTISINHYPSKRMMNKIKNNRYELESLPPLNKVPSETIVIQKTTNLNNCSNYAPFYFGTYGVNNVVEPALDSHLRNTSSRIFVSDYQFVSSVTLTGTIGAHVKKSVTMSTYVVLSLQDIRPAKKELGEIPNASETTILVNSDVVKISSTE